MRDFRTRVFKDEALCDLYLGFGIITRCLLILDSSVDFSCRFQTARVRFCMNEAQWWAHLTNTL